MKSHYFRGGIKKLAAAMALAIAVTAFPAAPAAQAASAPTFKTYRTSLYENGSAKSVYTYTVKNVKKGYTVKWSLSGAGVDYAELKYLSRKASGTTSSNKITLSTTGDMKAKNSKLSIIAKVYDTSNKLVKTVTDDVTLKIQASTVTLKTNKIKDSLTGLSTGEAYDFDKTFYPYNSTCKTHWTVTGSDGTDYSSQIDSAGIWKPVKEGTYTITVYARNSKNGKNLCQDSLTAVVGTSMDSITQTAADGFKAVFNTDVSKKITADSFTIKQTNGLASVLPKSVSFSTDGKTVTVSTHTTFKDNVSYTITCGSASKTFTASAGEITRMAILTDTVPVNTASPIEYALYDSKGIDVKANAKGTVEFTATVTNGYLTDDDKLFLTTIGKGGTITATYTDGSTTFSATKNIVAKEAEATEITSTDFTITDSLSVPNFTASDYKADTSVAIGETAYAHFRAVDSNKTAINYTKVTYESSDDNTLIVESNGKMTPIKEGKVVVIVNAFEGSVKTNYTFNITVTAAKKLSSIGLSSSRISMSNCGDENYIKYVDVIPYDQYGQKMGTEDCTVTVSETYNRDFASYNSNTGQLELSVPAGTSAGNYTLTVTMVRDSVSLTQRLVLTVVEVPYNSSSIGYKLELSTSGTTVDISLKDGNLAEDKIVYARLAQYQGGVFAGYTYFDSATIRRGSAYYTADLTADSSATEVSIGGGMQLPITLVKISDTGNNTGTAQKAATGSYSIVFKYNNKQYSLGFTVSDTQSAPSVSLKNAASTVTRTNALDLVRDCLNIPEGYEIIDCTAVGSTATGINITISSGNKIHISTITLRNQMTLKTSSGTNKQVYVTHVVNVNQTLTNK